MASATPRLYALCFGNPHLPGDSAAQNLNIKIDGVEFVSCNSAEEVAFYLDKPFVIIDVVPGLKTVREFSHRDVVADGSIASLHDFDLAYFLKLIEKLDAKREIRVIGLPQTPSNEDIRQLTELLEKKARG